MPLKREARIRPDQLPDFLERELPQAIEEFKDELMDECGEWIERFAKDYAARRLPSGGGTYLDSIKFTKQRSRKDVIGTLYSDHPFAASIELGTRPHEITPRTRKAMLLEQKLPERVTRYSKYSGETAIVKKVRHPGARAFHVFGNTARYLHKTLPKWIEWTLKRVGLE